MSTIYYGAFIKAPVSQALAPFIAGRTDDDPVSSKRVELFRLAAADNQAAVRFRFAHAGTDSWHWGIDNFGLYSIPQVNPPTIMAHPAYMRVPAFTDSANGYDLTMPTQPVGDERYINRYTMVWDVLLPADASWWMPFFNTAPNNGNDADFYVSDSGGLGIGELGYSSEGLIQPDTWYRVVFAANLSEGRVTVYLDGAPVHTRTGASLADGRFALYSDGDAGPDLRLFNEGHTSGDYTHEVLVNSFAFISRELTLEEVAAIGGPSVAGIVLPHPAVPITLGTVAVAEGQITFAWTGGVGPFQVQKKPSLSATAWQNLGAPTLERTVTDPAGGSAAFYRVLGQ